MGGNRQQETILDWRRQELSGFTREDNDVPFEAVLAEVGIKGKRMIESVVVDQGKASAINKAKVFIIVSHKNRLGRLFNRFANTKHFDPGPVKTFHEFDGHQVGDFGSDEGIGFGQDKVRC